MYQRQRQPFLFHMLLRDCLNDLNCRAVSGEQGSIIIARIKKNNMLPDMINEKRLQNLFAAKFCPDDFH